MKARQLRGLAAAPSAPGAGLRWLVGVTYLGIFGGLLMPLIYVSGLVIFPFVFLKLLVFQVLMAVTVPAYLVLAWHEPRYRPKWSFLFAALAVYFAALISSALFGVDWLRSWWGNQERMNGLFSLAHFAAWMVMTTSMLKTWPQWRRLLHWQVGVGFLMAVVALLQLPFPKLLGADSGPRVSGTLGNPIYSAGYHLFVLFFLGFLWLRAEGPSLRRWYVIGAAASVTAIFGAGSRGPLLGLMAGLAVMGVVWAIIKGRRRTLYSLFGSLVASVAAYVFIAKVLVPLPSLASFWASQGALQHLFLADFDPARQKLWAIAWQGFLERPWLGFGRNNYEYIFDQHYDPWFLCFFLAETLQDNPHSLLFEHLSTTGVVGVASFALLWGAVMWSFVRAYRLGRLDGASCAVLLGLTTAYLVQGLFVFDSPGTWSMSYLLLALAAALSATDFDASGVQPTLAPVLRPATTLAFVALQVVAVVLAWQTSVRPATASHLTKRAHAAFNAKNFTASLDYAQQAFATPTPWLEDQLAMVAMDLGALADKKKLSLYPQWHTLLDHGRVVATELFARHPLQGRQRGVYGGVLLALGREAKDPALLAEATPYFEQLRVETPRRQHVRYQYARLLTEQGRLAEAKAEYEQAVSVDPSIGDPHWKLGVFLWQQLRQPVDGASQMGLAVEGRCARPLSSELEVQQLAQAYKRVGNREKLKGIISRIEAFPPVSGAGEVHLQIARFFEDAAMLPERDRMLELARAREPTLTARLAPLRDGRVRTLAELDQLSADPSPGVR